MVNGFVFPRFVAVIVAVVCSIGVVITDLDILVANDVAVLDKLFPETIHSRLFLDNSLNFIMPLIIRKTHN